MKQREFAITTHGRERLLARFGCKERKLLKVVQKAWKSKQSFNVPRKYLKQNGYHVRYYMGFVFIFSLHHDPLGDIIRISIS